MNSFQENLYNDLMNLISYEDSPFYSVDHILGDKHFRVFTYRLASYTDFLRSSALEARGIMFAIDDLKNPLYLASLTPQKFFNYGENPLSMNIDWSKSTEVFDKLDGSIMSTYDAGDGEVRLKSKTSLSSEQAIEASKFLNKKENAKFKIFLEYAMNNDITVSMEWTSPIHRIVLGYGESSLTVFSARNNLTGERIPHVDLVNMMEDHGCFNYVQNLYDSIDSSIEEFVESIPDMTDSIEDYVIYADGKPLKIKTNLYSSLHKNKDSINNDRNLFQTVVYEGHDDLRSMFTTDILALERIDKMEDIVKFEFNSAFKIVESFYNDNKELDRKSYAILGTDTLEKKYFTLAMFKFIGKEFDYQEWLIKNYETFNIPKRMGTILTID